MQSMPCIAPLSSKGLPKVTSMTHELKLGTQDGIVIISACELIAHQFSYSIKAPQARCLFIQRPVSKGAHDRPLLSHVRWAHLSCYVSPGSKWSHLGGTQQSLQPQFGPELASTGSFPERLVSSSGAILKFMDPLGGEALAMEVGGQGRASGFYFRSSKM